MVALDYFQHLDKLYAWEEKKSKTSWGAQTVDYEKIAVGNTERSGGALVRRLRKGGGS